jgi:death-on-curing protein
VYENADVADLAAAYAFGLVQNHGFVDGNKRSAWVTARAFLANGYRPDCGDEEAIELMVALVEHKLSESQVAQWFRKRL